MKRFLPFLIVVVVGLATVGSAVALYRAKQPKTLTISKDAAASGAHVLGPEKAPVTLEEFGDFECPPCGKMSEPLSELQREFNPQLKLVFHNFPLPNHKHAREAAWAAEAAALQGKFWQMHDIIYKEQEAWAKALDARPLLEAYAGYIGLDLERFKKDMNSDEVKFKVETDRQKGVSLGVQNTPTIFINDKQVDPKNLAPQKFREQVEAAVKNAKPSS
jgi:protein-disulfide isomerase